MNEFKEIIKKEADISKLKRFIIKLADVQVDIVDEKATYYDFQSFPDGDGSTVSLSELYSILSR